MAFVFEYAWLVIIPQMIDGLVIGMAVVLVALGLTMIFGLLGVINIAHGELYMLGAYVGLLVISKTGSYWLALLIAPVIIGLIGILIERVTIRPLANRRDFATLTILLTFGLSLILRDVAQLIWGVDTQTFDAPVHEVFRFGGIALSSYRLLVFALAGTAVLAVWYVIHRTMIGAVLRATAHDPLMVTALGISARSVRIATVAVSCALAGIAGVLLAPIYAIFPTMGHDFILLAFAVVIVGGLGSVAGAVVAGLGLSQLHSLGSLVVPPVWAETIVFGAMIAVLAVRPNGLFGRLGS